MASSGRDVLEQGSETRGEGLWEFYYGVWNLAISNWESQCFQGKSLLVFIRLTSVAVKDGSEEQDQRL